MIESVNNERVKNWAKLNEKKYQFENGLFLVEGEHLVEEAERAGCLEEVIVLDGYEDISNCPLRTVVKEAVMKKISSLSTVPHIIGVARMMQPRNIEGNVLLLDAIQDPGNLGTIIRSAVAFGIDTLVLGEGTVNIYNPKVVRASEGILFHINIVIADLSHVIENLKDDGYTVYSTRVDGGKPLEATNVSENYAVVIGNEGSGVSPKIESLCDEYLYIPMEKECESLNAGVATSIILYEMSKKYRKNKTSKTT